MISRRLFAIAVVGACVLAAAIGSATTLLVAERGPTGFEGVEGPPGPEGEGADEAMMQAEGVGGQVEELASRVDAVESEVPFALESTVGELEGNVSNLKFRTELICSELGLICP